MKLKETQVHPEMVVPVELGLSCSLFMRTLWTERTDPMLLCEGAVWGVRW